MDFTVGIVSGTERLSKQGFIVKANSGFHCEMTNVYPGWDALNVILEYERGMKVPTDSSSGVT